jgi:hypothetical protein
MIIFKEKDSMARKLTMHFALATQCWFALSFFFSSSASRVFYKCQTWTFFEFDEQLKIKKRLSLLMDVPAALVLVKNHSVIF